MYAYVTIFNQLSRTRFPVAEVLSEVLSAAELSFSLDLEVMSFTHSTSSPMWHYEFNCSEKTRYLFWEVNEQELWTWREDLSLLWNGLGTASPHEQTPASGQVSLEVCWKSWIQVQFE